jgi:hypothetical protein
MFLLIIQINKQAINNFSLEKIVVDGNQASDKKHLAISTHILF